MSFNSIKNLKRFWSNNKNFTSTSHGNNRDTQPLNGRTVYQKTVSYNDWFNSLQNHYMLPSDSAIAGYSLALVMIATIASLLF